MTDLSFLWSSSPLHLVLFVTARCNLRCDHCFYRDETRASSTEPELTTGEIAALARGYGRLRYLTLSGGEPLLRDDLPDICESFRRYTNVTTVALHTNGSIPDKTAWVASEILDRCPGMFLDVCVSLDGFQTTHDRLRGASGSFSRAVQTVRVLRELTRSNPRLSLDVTTVWLKDNMAEMERLHEFVQQELGVMHYVELARGNHLAGRLDADDIRAFVNWLPRLRDGCRPDKKDPLAAAKWEIDLVSHQIIAEQRLTSRRVVRCIAGRRSVVVSETGTVRPCEPLKETMGELRQHGFRIRDILASDTARRVVDGIKSRGCHCDWRCIVPLGLVYDWRRYPALARRLLANRHPK